MATRPPTMRQDDQAAQRAVLARCDGRGADAAGSLCTFLVRGGRGSAERPHAVRSTAGTARDDSSRRSGARSRANLSLQPIVPPAPLRRGRWLVSIRCRGTICGLHHADDEPGRQSAWRPTAGFSPVDSFTLPEGNEYVTLSAWQMPGRLVATMLTRGIPAELDADTVSVGRRPGRCATRPRRAARAPRRCRPSARGRSPRCSGSRPKRPA